MKAKILVSIIILLSMLTAAGCGPIVVGGPFVTHIGYDGEGNLVITKNTMVYDHWSGGLSNGANPQTIIIKSPKR